MTLERPGLLLRWRDCERIRLSIRALRLCASEAQNSCPGARSAAHGRWLPDPELNGGQAHK